MKNQEHILNKKKKVELDIIIGPSKSLVYGVVVILLGALGYFIYNFYVCHKKKIDYGLDGDEEHHYEIEI